MYRNCSGREFSILSSTERSGVRIEGCGFAWTRRVRRTPFDELRTGFDTISASLQSLRMLPLGSYYVSCSQGD